MKKENILYAIIGLLGGLILGFIFANSYMRSELANPRGSTAMASNSNIPADHPEINGQQPKAPLSPEVQPAMDNAKSNPNDFEAQKKAGELSYQAEKYEESLEFYKTANKLKPEDYEIIVNIGNVAFDGGKFDEAEKWYSTALEKKKDDNNVRTDLGLTFVFRPNPNYDRAIQEFNTVLTSEPNHIQALQNSIVAYLRKGDTAKAKENLTKLEAADPKNSAIPRLKEQITKPGAN